jgi:hypothetical protein
MRVIANMHIMTKLNKQYWTLTHHGLSCSSWHSQHLDLSFFSLACNYKQLSGNMVVQHFFVIFLVRYDKSVWCMVSNELDKSSRLYTLNKLPPKWNLSYPHTLLGFETWQTTFHLQIVEAFMAKRAQWYLKQATKCGKQGTVGLLYLVMQPTG